VEALAILAAGHCLVPVNGQLPSSQRDELMDRAGIHALRNASTNELTLCAGQPIDLASDDDYRALTPAYLRFTSGSTGQRKGVLLSHPTLLARTEAANTRLHISPSDRVLCLLPMVDHFIVSILLYLRYGATILLVENAADAPAFAEAESATVLYGAPNQYRQFENPLPHLRLAVSTTQGLSAAIANAFLEKTGQPITQALGIIEAGLLTLNDTHAATDPLLAGEPMPDYHLTIVSDDSRAGEIHVAGPGLLDAYVSPWRPQTSLLHEHGLATGDHGWLDDSGCLHLVGREKNRLQFDGSSFFCEEIESTINQNAVVFESLVFQRGEYLVAQVVPRDPAIDIAELSKLLGDELKLIHAPLQVEIVTALPLTPTGKLARPHAVAR
jgi:long-chain acyl-CoA synthetase